MGYIPSWVCDVCRKRFNSARGTVPLCCGREMRYEAVRG